MNKAEYIQSWDSKAHRIGPCLDITAEGLDPNKTGPGVKLYSLWYLRKLANGFGQGVTQLFYVEDEGTPEENVVPINQELENEVVDQFEASARAYIDSNFISEAMPKVTIDVVNSENKFVIATAYSVVNGKIETSKWFLYIFNGSVVVHPYAG